MVLPEESVDRTYWLFSDEEKPASDRNETSRRSRSDQDAPGAVDRESIIVIVWCTSPAVNSQKGMNAEGRYRIGLWVESWS
jgi:hypothetical protein